MKDSFGRHWKLVGGLAAEAANRRESIGGNRAFQAPKFNTRNGL